MASSVFFKFKSQKEPTRVEFDGTGISVFELKREIILRSGLGDGADFDLVIYADEGMTELYDDDLTIIPRSHTVIARRLPPKVVGRGNGVRYISGKMPIHAKNSSRREQGSKASSKAAAATSEAIAQMNNALTEEEKLGALFQAQSSNWSAVGEDLAHQQYIERTGGQQKKPGRSANVNVPDHDPPQGYICYRCGEKGHWIQVCPTNDDPEYDNRPRLKRTTGIPRSFLKTVDKETALGQTGDGDSTKAPSGVMVNADGEYVIAEPDKRSWEQYQAKANVNTVAGKASAEGDKVVQEHGLECPLDKKMFIDPMKTECCGTTYCNDCITNALIENDLVCPGCKKENVLIDDLKPDEEAADKIRQFLSEKSEAKSKSPSNKGLFTTAPAGTDASKTASPKQGAKPPIPGTACPPCSIKLPTEKAAQTSNIGQTATNRALANGNQQLQNTMKRPAEEPSENPKIPKAPKAMQKAQEQQASTQMPNGMFNMAMPNGVGCAMNGMNAMNGLGNMVGMGMDSIGMGGMAMMPFGMPMMNNFSGMSGMGMFNPIMNPIMNNGMPNMGGPPNMNSGGFGPMGGNCWASQPHMPNPGPGYGNNSMGGPGTVPLYEMTPNVHSHSMGNNGFGNCSAPMVQGPPRKVFSAKPAAEDAAYFRAPVNPHRHQARQRRIRPSDYREL